MAVESLGCVLCTRSLTPFSHALTDHLKSISAPAQCSQWPCKELSPAALVRKVIADNDVAELLTFFFSERKSAVIQQETWENVHQCVYQLYPTMF